MINQPPPRRTGLMPLLWPVAGFFVVIAFGVGLVSMAASDSRSDQAVAASASGASDAAQTIDVELGDLFLKPDPLRARAGPFASRLPTMGRPSTTSRSRASGPPK